MSQETIDTSKTPDSKTKKVRDGVALMAKHSDRLSQLAEDLEIAKSMLSEYQLIEVQKLEVNRRAGGGYEILVDKHRVMNDIHNYNEAHRRMYDLSKKRFEEMTYKLKGFGPIVHDVIVDNKNLSTHEERQFQGLPALLTEAKDILDKAVLLNKEGASGECLQKVQQCYDAGQYIDNYKKELTDDRFSLASYNHELHDRNEFKKRTPVVVDAIDVDGLTVFAPDMEIDPIKNLQEGRLAQYQKQSQEFAKESSRSYRERLETARSAAMETDEPVLVK